MKYKSTRGGESGISFENAVMKGLADDGGLFIPEEIPQLRVHDLWKDSCVPAFEDVFFNVLSKFISPEEIPEHDLKKIISNSFVHFRVKNVVEVKPVGNFFVLELFHGPTYSFKDVALQFLGNLFEYFLTRAVQKGTENAKRITIVGATSGDTGSAAIQGLRGKKQVEVVILFPEGRVSKIQEMQMTTVLDKNVHNIAVKGTFDDCQAVVKAIFNDLEFKRKFSLGAINSINLARILAQISYYVYSYLVLIQQKIIQFNPDKPEEVCFSVPTGNFGDILAGYYAKKMGLPIKQLICATNSNNILHRFFSEGKYHRNSEVFATHSPSMDIQVASNFERYLYYLSGNDASLVRSWMSEFDRTGKLTLSDKLSEANKDILSEDVSENLTLETIKKVFTEWNYLICPHTAVGIASALKRYPQLATSESKVEPIVVCLATAHNAKFGSAVTSALGKEFPLPDAFQALLTKDSKFTTMENNSDKVKQYISKHVPIL